MPKSEITRKLTHYLSGQIQAYYKKYNEVVQIS